MVYDNKTGNRHGSRNNVMCWEMTMWKRKQLKMAHKKMFGEIAKRTKISQKQFMM